MKRIFIALVALAVLATFMHLCPVSKHSVPTVYASSGCTVATLNGHYAFTDSGFAAPPREPVILSTPEVPVAATGVLTFNGAGNVSFNFNLAINGSIFPPSSDTGTYTVNSDCTGSMSFTSGDIVPVGFSMVIIGGGTEVVGILTDPGNTQTYDAKKQ